MVYNYSHASADAYTFIFFYYRGINVGNNKGLLVSTLTSQALGYKINTHDATLFTIPLKLIKKGTFSSIVYVVNAAGCVNKVNESLYQAIPRTIRYCFKD